MDLLKVLGLAGVGIIGLLIWTWLENESWADLPDELSDTATRVREKLLSRRQTKQMVDEMNDQAQRRYDKKVIHQTAVELADDELIQAGLLDDVVGRDAAGWIWGIMKITTPSIAHASLIRATQLEMDAWNAVNRVN